MAEKIEIDEIYGVGKVLEELERRNGKRIVRVKCLVCGEEFICPTINVKKRFARCTHADNFYGKLPKDSPCVHCKLRDNNGDSCSNYRFCPSWRTWFSYNWNDIRKAAEKGRRKRRV